jgi:hypothetical protein
VKRDNGDNMLAMRKRDLNNLHGKVWEVFCREWLKAEHRDAKGMSTSKYKNVWLLHETPRDVLDMCGLEQLDSGIDIIAELWDDVMASIPFKDKVSSRYVPVQCKFRSPNKLGYVKKITWDELSTFCGLVNMTGPWVHGLVMVNSRGIGNRVPKKSNDTNTNDNKDTKNTHKDTSNKNLDVRKQRKTILHERFHTIAFTKLDHTSLEQWQRVAGTSIGHRLVNSSVTNESSNNTTSNDNKAINKRRTKKITNRVGGEEKPDTLEELRAKRLVRFGN